MVRRGTKEGWVEIMLCSGDPGRPYVIRRSLHADHNSSQWRLNGKTLDALRPGLFTCFASYLGASFGRGAASADSSGAMDLDPEAAEE